MSPTLVSVTWIARGRVVVDVFLQPSSARDSWALGLGRIQMLECAIGDENWLLSRWYCRLDPETQDLSLSVVRVLFQSGAPSASRPTPQKRSEFPMIRHSSKRIYQNWRRDLPLSSSTFPTLNPPNLRRKSETLGSDLHLDTNYTTHPSSSDLIPSAPITMMRESVGSSPHARRATCALRKLNLSSLLGWEVCAAALPRAGRDWSSSGERLLSHLAVFDHAQHRKQQQQQLVTQLGGSFVAPVRRDARLGIILRALALREIRDSFMFQIHERRRRRKQLTNELTTPAESGRRRVMLPAEDNVFQSTAHPDGRRESPCGDSMIAGSLRFAV
ncbi:hypothetical protein DFH09DRAFT_1097720 [Mycena vulgaris]|nr:hypothetical protein DFH09DRAFT_1097720 [Mycena vulgaris]